MNPTSLEYLYQVAPPVPDRAPTTSRSDDDSSGFDNHLSQAASSVLDIVRTPSAPSSRSSYSPSPRSTTDRDTSDPSDSVSRPIANKPQKDQTTNDSSTQLDASAPNDKSQPTSRDDDKHDEKRDGDHSDTTPAAAAAGTAQPAAKETARKADSKDAKGDSDQGKDKIAADVLSKTPTADTNTNTSTNTQAADEKQAITVEAKTNTEVAKNNQGATTAAATAAPASEQAKAVSEKNPKATAHTAKAAAAAKDADPTKTTSKDPATSQSSGSSLTAAAATTSSPAAEAIAEADQTAASQSDSKSDSAAIGQSIHDHKDAASENVQTAVPATPAATDITSAVANVTVPSPINAVTEKPKPSDDSAIKPVAEKTDATVGPLGRTLRTDLASNGGTSSANDASPVDVSRFVSRVAKAVQTANDRDGIVNLRLSPSELGSLKIQLTVKDGVMSASVEADNSNARRMLLDHLPALRDRLADQNIRVDRFDVDVKQENTGGQASPRGFNQNPYQQQAQENDSRRPATKASQAESAAPAETVAAAPRVSSTGINLVI